MQHISWSVLWQSFGNMVRQKAKLCCETTSSLSRSRLTVAPLGGGQYSPLCIFLNNKKTAARSPAKFSIASRASIWHLHTQLQVLGYLRSGVIEVELRSCSSKNEQKTLNLETLTWQKLQLTSNFEALYLVVQRKNGDTKPLSGILKLLSFWPPNWKIGLL